MELSFESLDEFGTRLAAQVTNIDNLTKRAIAKYSSDSLVKKLLASPRQNHKGYNDTLRCCYVLNEGVDEKLRSWGYCDRRHCIVCNRIKTAQLIEAYLPLIKAMPAPHFVTLTVKNVEAVDLASTLKEMQKEFAKIIDSGKKRRGGRVPLDGLKKIEVTYNNDPSSKSFDTFHPHFHVIVASSMDAEQLYLDWISNAAFTVDWKGQDFREADENSVMELFKYVSKLHFKTDRNDPESDKRAVEAVDVIMNAINGVQLFKPFGNLYGAKIKPPETPKTGAGINEEPEARHEWRGHDWEEKRRTEIITVDRRVIHTYPDGRQCFAEFEDKEVKYVPTGRLLTGFKPRSKKEASQTIAELFGLDI